MADDRKAAREARRNARRAEIDRLKKGLDSEGLPDDNEPSIIVDTPPPQQQKSQQSQQPQQPQQQPQQQQKVTPPSSPQLTHNNNNNDTRADDKAEKDKVKREEEERMERMAKQLRESKEKKAAADKQQQQQQQQQQPKPKPASEAALSTNHNNNTNNSNKQPNENGAISPTNNASEESSSSAASRKVTEASSSSASSSLSAEEESQREAIVKRKEGLRQQLQALSAQIVSYKVAMYESEKEKTESLKQQLQAKDASPAAANATASESGHSSSGGQASTTPSGAPAGARRSEIFGAARRRSLEDASLPAAQQAKLAATTPTTTTTTATVSTPTTATATTATTQPQASGTPASPSAPRAAGGTAGEPARRGLMMGSARRTDSHLVNTNNSGEDTESGAKPKSRPNEKSKARSLGRLSGNRLHRNMSNKNVASDISNESQTAPKAPPPSTDNDSKFRGGSLRHFKKLLQQHQQSIHDAGVGVGAPTASQTPRSRAPSVLNLFSDAEPDPSAPQTARPWKPTAVTGSRIGTSVSTKKPSDSKDTTTNESNSNTQQTTAVASQSRSHSPLATNKSSRKVSLTASSDGIRESVVDADKIKKKKKNSHQSDEAIAQLLSADDDDESKTVGSDPRKPHKDSKKNKKNSLSQIKGSVPIDKNVSTDTNAKLPSASASVSNKATVIDPSRRCSSPNIETKTKTSVTTKPSSLSLNSVNCKVTKPGTTPTSKEPTPKTSAAPVDPLEQKKAGLLRRTMSMQFGKGSGKLGRRAAGGKDQQSALSHDNNNPAAKSVYGCTIEQIMALQTSEEQVPEILVGLAEAIIALGGQSAEGIFRLSAEGSCMNELRAHFDKTKSYSFLKIIKVTADPHVAAGCLKLWLRMLAEPLIPASLYDACIAIARNPTEAYLLICPDDDKLRRLPDCNRAVVDYILAFLGDLSQYSAQTRMDAGNLCLVFAPGFLRYTGTDPATILSNSALEVLFMESLLEGYQLRHPKPVVASTPPRRLVKNAMNLAPPSVTHTTPTVTTTAPSSSIATATSTATTTSKSGSTKKKRGSSIKEQETSTASTDTGSVETTKKKKRMSAKQSAQEVQKEDNKTEGGDTFIDLPWTDAPTTTKRAKSKKKRLSSKTTPEDEQGSANTQGSPNSEALESPATSIDASTAPTQKKKKKKKLDVPEQSQPQQQQQEQNEHRQQKSHEVSPVSPRSKDQTERDPTKTPKLTIAEAARLVEEDDSGTQRRPTTSPRKEDRLSPREKHSLAPSNKDNSAGAILGESPRNHSAEPVPEVASSTEPASISPRNHSGESKPAPISPRQADPISEIPITGVDTSQAPSKKPLPVPSSDPISPRSESKKQPPPSKPAPEPETDKSASSDSSVNPKKSPLPTIASY
eukprot:TRINITY_DN766_c0_g1_i6.p1 TRINITY_DN766_c0_g1~~TRINITY_DN766_c0_g1_i6.p1  ORF type:complete len:1379 (-),score=359.70 TRINITY_DN766_c0_g1_i6:112-4248(-)